MKVMIVGSDKVYAIENFYVKHFRASGISVDHFTAQAAFYNYYQKSLLNKLIYKAGLSTIIRKINQSFIQEVRKVMPDVVWVFKGMEISPSSLRKVKAMGVALANYNPDNPFIFTGKGSGNSFVTRSIDLYDLHFTYNLAVEKMLKERQGSKTAFLPFGFEISEDLYQDCAQQQEIVKACFLGNPDKQRATFIEALAERGISIDVYGNHWNRYVRHASVTIFQPVYGDELWRTLRKYRVQLNMMRVHNEDSHNMRTFEVPGVGGIMVAPSTPEHLLFFKNGVEAFFYHDANECAEIISKLLAIDIPAAESIRQHARNASLQKKYEYKYRAAEALGVLKQLVHYK
jgi:hypothetical protein